jgi:antitoxin ParD1/3/4
MNVSLTPELEEFVEAQLRTGRYQSASEVFREGLRLLEQAEQQRLLEKWLVEGLSPQESAQLPPGLTERARSVIRAKVQEGLDAARRGELLDGDEVVRELRERARRRRAAAQR